MVLLGQIHGQGLPGIDAECKADSATYFFSRWEVGYFSLWGAWNIHFATGGKISDIDEDYAAELQSVMEASTPGERGDLPTKYLRSLSYRQDHSAYFEKL